MSLQPTFVDVMRHGEPEGSCPDGGTILRGSIDHVLTPKGWKQAEQRIMSVTGDLFSSRLEPNNLEVSANCWDVVITSPLRRCSEFATALVKNSTTELFIKDPWRELDYGDWEGLSTQKIWQDSPEIMEKMWQAPLEFCAPNGEPVKEFSQRINHAWNSLLSEFQGKRILLVCHGGVIRVLLQQLLLMSPEGMNRFAIPYAAMTRFRVDHSQSSGNIQHWPSLISHASDEIKPEPKSRVDV
jgi:alpha-ribazole phosphatase